MGKTDAIRSLFNNIAPSYDRLNHLLSLNVDKIWRRKGVKEIVVANTAQQILDVACGTGDFAIAIALKANPQTKVVGIDISDGMLDVCKKKVTEINAKRASKGECKNHTLNITTQIENSEDMSFPSDTFDRVSVAFGIRNFDDRASGLREMLRVLRHGGRLVILELSIPSNSFVAALYKLYFFKILPCVGGWISCDRAAYEYLPRSVANFPRPEVFAQLMTDCGFTQVSHRSLSFGLCQMYIGVK